MRHVRRHDCVQNPPGTGPAGHRQSPQGTDDAVSLVAPPCRSGRPRAGGGVMATIACAACKASFHPRRSTARYCSDRCRVAHARSRSGMPARVSQAAVGAVLSVTGHAPSASATKPAPGACVTLIPQQTRASKPSSRKLDPRIVPNAKWPGMYRVRLPDGSLTDMLNLARAKDALLSRAA